MKMSVFPSVLERKLVDRTYISKAGKQCVMKTTAVVLNEQQRQWFAKWFPRENNAVLAQAMGCCKKYVAQKAREMGLTKSKQVKKRAVQKAKETCERLGVYESRRGKRAECLDKFWQSVSDGTNENPMLTIKRTNRRRYNAIQKRKGDALKGTYHKEQLRLTYGLDRKTNLVVRRQNYTEAQRSCRYKALNRGYFVMHDCSDEGGERYNIYYDQDTQRSGKFEQNCIKNGFRILAAS